MLLIYTYLPAKSTKLILLTVSHGTSEENAACWACKTSHNYKDRTKEPKTYLSENDRENGM